MIQQTRTTLQTKMDSGKLFSGGYKAQDQPQNIEILN